jgi:hypothetical protein
MERDEHVKSIEVRLADANDDIVVLCHPVKKDGTASRTNRHISYGEFIECI